MFPDSAADRVYEHARIKKLENRILNKKEKHIIKMKDSFQGKLIKLSEQLSLNKKPQLLTKKSNHIHKDDLDAVKNTDFGEDAPYFKSNKAMRAPEANEIISSAVEILQGMPLAELLSDCRNPKISRIVQNMIRHSTKDEMVSLLSVLFREKMKKSEQALPNEFGDGASLNAKALGKYCALPYDNFMQFVRHVPKQPLSTKALSFLNTCADNYASFIVCTMIRHAPHSVFSTILHELCVPFLPMILTHKSMLRIAHFLFINRFAGKKERNLIMMSLLMGSLVAQRDKISKKSVQGVDVDEEKVTPLSVQELLKKETDWWSSLSNEDKAVNTLHAHCALFYCCQLFVEKSVKAVTFPLCIAFLTQALSIDVSSLPADLVDVRAELISSAASAMAQCTGVLFTASSSLATECSEDTFAVLSMLVKEASDEQFAELVAAIGPYSQKILAFSNKPGRFGSHRLFCAIVMRCAASHVVFKGIAPSFLRNVVHTDIFKECNRAIFEAKRQKRRRRKTAAFHCDGIGSEAGKAAVRLCIEILQKLVTGDVQDKDALSKSFFSQYPVERFPSMDKSSKEYIFLMLTVFYLDLQRCDEAKNVSQICLILQELRVHKTLKKANWHEGACALIDEALADQSK